MPANDLLLQRFCDLYDAMGANHIPALEAVYHPEVVFSDPLTSVQGLGKLSEYLTDSYRNVISCRFRYADPVMDEGAITQPWTMMLRHRRLASGRTVEVEGVSVLRIRDGLIAYHRDYYDAGQLLYENVPVLGAAVRWLRRHAA